MNQLKKLLQQMWGQIFNQNALTASLRRNVGAASHRPLISKPSPDLDSLRKIGVVKVVSVLGHLKPHGHLTVVGLCSLGGQCTHCFVKPCPIYEVNTYPESNRCETGIGKAKSFVWCPAGGFALRAALPCGQL